MYSSHAPSRRLRPAVQSTRLFDQVRERIRYLHYSLRTEEAYLHWIQDYIRFHERRHPRELGGEHVEQFLNALVNERKVAAATHKQALCALLFLYWEVFDQDMPWMTQMHRPSVHKRIPSVLTVDEVQRVLDHMEGQTSLVARLLYGTGMRLMEGLRLWGSTTMIYTHVLKIAAGTVTSPLDRMACPA
ncbi:MAG TPA: phage integrase N-terminal SAM-like domain-containing protein [Quisquiliibacterium sp.]|nr:phage integrase N-terminal SAM-like domain-containing protein [Quisquiliibacterium sp.]HQN13630.1 phage integrase N-terminal SAM-like domain-containing protein [Quisquiliibacterium sp.]